MTRTVGVLGIGVMGASFARNIAQSGFEVVGFDPHPAASERLVSFGARSAASPLEVVKRCEIIVTSLPSSKALMSVVGDEAGIAAAAISGRIVIECSTLSIQTKKAAFDTLASAGVTLLDCPVSGTGAQAANKDLVVFGSGDRAAYDAAFPVLQAFTRAQYFLGAFGNGSTMKFIANHLVAIHNVAAAEAMVLGMKAGLDPAVVYETIADSAATSRMFQVRGPMMRDNRYEPATAAIQTFLKDLSIISEFATGLDCPVPLFATATQAYLAGAAQGRKHQDTASVCAVYEQIAGIARK